MVFAPKLSEGVAFNQPVQQPNAMEAIAGLFNFGVSTLKKSGDGPKLTEDEKFAIALKEFESEKGAAFTLDRKTTREFIFKNPQFSSQMKTHAENLGVMTVAPQEVARDAANDWFGTPEGMLAVAQASQLPEEQQEAYLAEQVTKVKAQEAKLAELERNNATYAAEGTLVTRQWDVLKPGAKDMVDNTVSTILNPIISDVMNGLTVEIPPELQSQLGIRYGKVDMNNLNAVLSDTKLFLERQARSSFASNFGQDALPADDWNKEVFASIDGIMKIGESVKDPVARAATQKALIDSEMYKKLDENGVAIVVRLAEVLPPENLARLIGDMAQFDESFSKALAGGGSVFGTAGIKSAINDGSKADAESLANDVIQTFEYGVVPEFFTAFKEAQKRSGYNVVDGESFKKIVSGNIPDIIQKTRDNPDFRMEFGDWLNSDIQQTVSTIRSNLIAGVNLEFDGKQFVLVPEAGTLAAQKWNDPYRPYSKSAENQLPPDMGLAVLNEKIATLGLMGEFGKEIQEAVGILNTEPKAKTKEPTRGGQPPRGRGRGRNVGAELGIDFEGYETEAGLPQGYLNTMAIIESGGDPSAQNDNSSAGGLFQQIDANAAAYGVSNRFDPVQSTEGAVRFAQDNTVALARVLGREPTGGELYLAHQQGPGGATKLLSNPDALAVDLVGLDAVKLNGGNANMTAQEFANIWINKYNKIASGGIGPAGAPVSTLPAGDRGTAPTAGPTLSLDSGATGIPTGTQGASTVSTEALRGNLISFESPEVQQIIEKTTSAPEEAIAMAKEMLTKPMDPSIKALIEALVRIGER
jgi:hypothetical protein